MSSEDDYEESSDDDNGDDDDEVGAPRSSHPVGGSVARRGVKKSSRPPSRGGAKSSSPPPPRRSPRKYTARDIDREIAMQRRVEDNDDTNDDESEGNGGGREGTITTGRKSSIRRAVVSMRRKAGYKRPRARASGSGGRGKKKAGGRGVKKGNGSSSSSSSSEEEGGGGEEWNGSDESDGSDGGYEEEGTDSDLGKSSTRRTMGVARRGTIGRGGRRGGRSAGGGMARASSWQSTRRAAVGSARRDPLRDEDDYDDDGGGGDASSRYEPKINGGSTRPRRGCKAQTMRRMSAIVRKDMQSEREALMDFMLEDDDIERLADSSDADVGGEGEGKGVDDDDAEDSGRRGVTSRARSKKGVPSGGTRAIRRKFHVDDDDDEDYDEDAPSDDGTGNSDDNEDASDLKVDDDDDDDLPNRRRSCRSRERPGLPSYRDVDDSEEGIGTADEDSDDEDTAPAVLMSPARKSSSAFGGSPGSGARAVRARMGRAPLDVHDDEDDDNESDFDGGRKAKGGRTSRMNDDDECDDEDDDDRCFNASNSRSPTRLKTTHINCPSKTDNITMAPLPKNKPHVCYIAPDGVTRHCFALDTLYRIAISARNNGNDGASSSLGRDSTSSGALKFLQPPHFRVPMEDDLLDQIASRFGRSSLVIEHSSMYKKMKGSAYLYDDELDDFDEDGEFIGHNAGPSGGRATFRERFERYMQSLMGSADIYCCPLCFIEADRRRGIVDDELLEDDDDEDDALDDGNDVGGDRFSFMDDPLTILGSLDQEEFVIASSFCFRYLSDVKSHMSVVHGVNLKDIAGSDLFKRFQIRASDGLLQSWLKRSLRRAAVQGDMMHYWLGGENQSFILLMNQIDKGRARGKHSRKCGSDFSFSFPNRARKIWRDVSAPYSTQLDMEDFIAEEGDEASEEEEGRVSADLPVNPHFTPPNAEKGEDLKSPEERMIQHLREKKRMRRKYDSSDNDSTETNDDKDSEDCNAELSDDDASEGSEYDELEVLPKPSQYEEVEDNDDWIKAKLLKVKKSRHGRKGNDTNDSDHSDFFESNSETKNTETRINSSDRKKVIDDDDKSSGSDSDRKPKPQMHTDGGSARKRVIEGSDEESF